MAFCIHREESSLVDQFVFEVLVIFVESLALAHSDERSLGNGGAPFIHTLQMLQSDAQMCEKVSLLAS